MSNITLLSSLQAFLNQRGVVVERLTADAMIPLMVDWFRLEPIEGAAADTLLFRYAGWSEGCVTGFKFGLLRRVAAVGETQAEWLAGITLIFEPSRYATVEPLTTLSRDWQTLEAFVRAIESSQGFRLSVSVTPMAVMVESHGLR
jgi:hypothetical protein